MRKKTGRRVVIAGVVALLVSSAAITAYTTDEPEADNRAQVRDVSNQTWVGPVSEGVAWDNHKMLLPQLPHSIGQDVSITVDELDFGDAPGAYGTLSASDGARHAIVPNVWLGIGIDADADGQPGADALGDDNDGGDDEDGVVFISLVIPGDPATVKVTASIAGFLDAWVDFNFDGDWSDDGECIFAGIPVALGANTLTFNVPATTPTGITYSRFRFSTTGNLGWLGFASDGEVEDYRVFILEPIPDVKMHWPQLPDLDYTGMDVSNSIALADDWLCTETGPVTDIHFWGSFAEDDLPAAGVGSLSFYVLICSDIPATPTEPSMPGTPLWTRNFYPGEYTVLQVADNCLEDWYELIPPGQWLQGNHVQAYQYSLSIDEDYFVQDIGTIYWLLIQHYPEEGYAFGWKTTRIDLHYQDAAVYYAGEWVPLSYPGGHQHDMEPLDLAFVIASGEVPVLCGDVNTDGRVDLGDVVYLINFIFRPPSPAPHPYQCVGDVNNDNLVNVGDIIYLLNFLYRPPWPPPDPLCCTPWWAD